MGKTMMSLTELRGEWEGQPARVEVDEYGNCVVHLEGAGQLGGGEAIDIGLVNPFAFRLLMEGLGVALKQEPQERLLRVAGTNQWTRGGVAPDGPDPA